MGVVYQRKVARPGAIRGWGDNDVDSSVFPGVQPPHGVPRASVKVGHGRERCLPNDVLERFAAPTK